MLKEPPPELAAGVEVQAVNDLMSAFNNHDPDGMREYWHQDVTWFEIAGNDTSAITTSADQLHGELVSYFEALPSVSSTLENISSNGRFVTAVERAVWEQDGERKSQTSNVVYEVVDGRVKRFWYFSPQ